ncbi:MAG TPA: PAS domain S-box protein [Candidatus Acidoferrales bacterium]|jgi:PAS domain S-box-containing protein|nr:PAS domain S-box protein [Candidatus Acidoferrales bacterium]
MRKTDHNGQDNRPRDVDGRNLPDSVAGPENLNASDLDHAESDMTTQLSNSSDLLNLGSQTQLIELFPMAAYAVRAPDGVIAWFNSRAAKLWGRVPALNDTDERFCGAYKLYHGDGRHMAHSDTPVALALQTGISVHEQEVVVEKPDGSRVTVSVYIDPIRGNDGAVVGVVNFFHDISERKQAERTTGLLAAIVDSSDDAIVSKNLDGIITSWNNGAEQLFGYSDKEAIGQNIRLIVPQDRHHEEATILKHLARGERVDHFETVRVRKDGSMIDISATISPVRDAAGVVIGASKVARDITERKKTEKTIKEKELAAHLLKLQDEERRRIARELHDGVGQLLAAMSMNAARLDGEKGNLSPDAARCAEENSRLIHQVSADIRTISYLFHPPLLDELGLHCALKWYIDGFAERSKIAAKLELPADLERLPQDHELCLFRVAQECLTNIHRHSGSSTALVRLLRSPGGITLEVSDEGKGLNPEKQSKIFSGETAAVGLRGMRERVRQLGGKLEIRSNGHGTTVIATVPFVDSGDDQRESFSAIPARRAASQV